MRIDNDSKTDRKDTIRQIQEYQERQVQLQNQQQVQQQQTHEVERQQALEIGEGGASALRDAAAQQDIQAQLQQQPQQVQATDTGNDVSGDEKYGKAVDTASIQQDRGENWQAYAKANTDVQLPPSVEELNNNNFDQAQEQQQRINVGDLMRQMQIQSGKIGG